MNRIVIAAAVAAAWVVPTFAQDKPAASPPPSWQQGKPAAMSESTLHPFAIEMTGKASKDLPIDKLKVPAGFKVEVFAEGMPGARSLAEGDKGTLFVGTRQLKDVYVVTNRGGKREAKVLLKGLDAPNGLVFNKGTLFVAERGRITRYDNIEANLDNPPQPKVIVDNLDPNNQPGHFWKFLALGPDGKLYFNIGAPGNIVMPTYMEASIMRVDMKGTLETVALGVRNSVGMDFHPKTKELWFTNHARDWLSDDLPNDTLHRVSGKSVPHFGYPFCHQGDTPDPEFGKHRSCKEFAKPALKLGAHIAPIGMRFYTGKMFPAEYQGNIFIAMRGSWNRTVKQGYNVMRVVLDDSGKVTKYEPFLTGFLLDEKADPPMWGRPNDVMVAKDGALLVSDDQNGIVYRISTAK